MARGQKYVILRRRGSSFPPDEHLYNGGWTKEPHNARTFNFEDAQRMLKLIENEETKLRNERYSVESHPYSLTFD